MIEQIDKEKYKEYYALSITEQSRIKETNCYRKKHSLPEISVPIKLKHEKIHNKKDNRHSQKV